jgi:glycosyltransferase involved in cell wall biosynthesis
MAIRKICILGLDDYAMLTGDPSFGHTGGESVQHVLLARAWRDLGHDVSIIVHDHGQPRVTMIDGVRAVAAFPRASGVRVLRFVHPRLTRVVSAMRELDADVYYQSPAAPWTGVTAFFARRWRKQSIFRVASDSDCLRERPAADGRPPLLRQRRDRWMYEYGVMNVSLVAAQTEAQRQLLLRNFGVHSEIVNIAVEAPSARPTMPKDVDVLWVGNLREVKRPDVLLELARRLPRRRFAVVGGSVPRGEAYYERIARDAAGVPNVAFIGPTPYAQVGAWFERSRVHVNTSDYEGFPNTFLQAWMRRAPVVSFCDPDGVIRRKGLGRACRDIGEMAAALDALLDDPAECAQIGLRGYAYAMKEFSATQVASRYLELLDSGAPCHARVKIAG